jgi:lipopolysaccharide transport system ATP-binding protein
MMVRLAFAVIAHVDADILVIDEALAVGDAVFTQKCMRWLRSFQKKGTILFVSHDTGSVLNLCDRAIWLKDGEIKEAGNAKEVCESYLLYTQQQVLGEELALKKIEAKNLVESSVAVSENIKEPPTENFFVKNLDNSGGWKTGAAEIISVKITDSQNNSLSSYKGGEQIILNITAKANISLKSPILGWFVRDKLGQCLFGEHTYTYIDPLPMQENDVVRAQFYFNLPMLPNGDYSITVSIADGDPHTHTQHHWLHNALIFKVLSEKLRYGLVGIQFKNVKLEKI